MKHFDLGPNAAGIRTQISISDDEMIMRDVQDAQPILDNNARLRNNPRARTLQGGYHVADIPITTWINWRREWKEKHSSNWEWKTYLAMKLNDRSFSKFRTNGMRI